MTLSTQSKHSTHPQACDNVAYLKQGLNLLDQIGDEHYMATMPPVFSSGVGAHIRHIIDHFDCLLAGLTSGRVDYDHRRRDRRVETDRLFAMESMRAIIDRLVALPVSDFEMPLEVHMDSGGNAPTWASSSLTRELQFLTSHTIHHYALVAAILGHAGCAVGGHFGISPSTLRHQRQ